MALLMAMEERLSSKLEKVCAASREAASQARMASEGLEQLESRVDANEECLMEALRESENRIMANVKAQVQDAVQAPVIEQVKEQVDAQLHAAGFDQNLTAGNLTLRSSIARQQVDESGPSTYESVVGHQGAAVAAAVRTSREEKREAKFWKARRSLRLWPIEGGRKESLEECLADKLRMDRAFVEDELGEVTIVKPREPKNKNKNEYIVTFESKQI